MPKIRRFSGDLKMELSFNDRTSQYQVKICPLVKGERCEKVTVGLPGRGYQTGRRGIAMAVDSPHAYTAAARSAISFASEDIQQYAAPSRDGSGWDVRRARGKRYGSRGR